MLQTLMTSLCGAVTSVLLTLTAAPAQADQPLFQAPMQYPGVPGVGHGAVVSADLDGDGYPDLAVVDLAAGAVRVLFNRGNGSFANAVLYPTGPGAAGLAAADFDGDGHVDLAVVNTVDSMGVVLTNRGDGTFVRGATFPTGLLPRRVLAADFNGDGRPDLAIANSAPADNVVVLLNQGGGRFARSQTLTMGIGVIAGFLSMETADVNGDHRPDLLVVEELRGVQVLIGRGDGTFGAGPTLPFALFEDVAVGDVNHDGIADIALPATFQGTVVVFLGRGDGSFAPPISIGVSPHFGVLPTLPVDVEFIDLNGDGNLDLAVSGGPDMELHLMLGDGTGRFTTTESYPVHIGRTIITDDSTTMDVRTSPLPSCLALPAVPRRSAGHRRTQDPALPAVAHRRSHRAWPAQRKIRILEAWPWAPPLAACLDAALAIPPPT